MKNLTSDKIMQYIIFVDRQRRNCNQKYGYMENIRYCEQLQTIFMFLWLCGAIDRKEYNTLSKKYKVRYKDMRKIIYTLDLANDDS